MSDEHIDFDALPGGITKQREDAGKLTYWLQRVLATYGAEIGDPWRDPEACRCAMMIVQILESRCEGDPMPAVVRYLLLNVDRIAVLDEKIIPKESIMPRTTWNDDSAREAVANVKHAERTRRQRWARAAREILAAIRRLKESDHD